MLSFMLTSTLLCFFDPHPPIAKDYAPFAHRAPDLDDPGPSNLSTILRSQSRTHALTSQISHGPDIDEPPPNGSNDKYGVIHDILRNHDLYAVLDVPKTADPNAFRRAYMKRCKACHPDKYPAYPLATVAFQKVSFAYSVLSTPSSRRLYDTHGMSSLHENGDSFTHPSYSSRADETLTGVLLGVFCDFMEGDFQMLRAFLPGQKYVRIVHFELIRLYEIQHSLRQLSYFDVCGRLRLTLQLARVTLSLPCAIDQALLAEAEEEDRARGLNGRDTNVPASAVTDGEQSTTKRRRGILHPRVNSMLISVCGVLEFGERVL
ncbi:hypothetical protein BS47DRAFT_1335544 [Hydnum rufescens UP504]|uniref:J domain-containing protein n=1 Tax=Hydnum rufescens UP504 TaxID=1448309 RepID=A0A9P6BB10_9AGAM|nr:hypothetical protein BS47DRAFT_1335544 [Hydnum rufescens UP504]